MKKQYLLSLLMLACTLGFTANAQEINNPGFEDWENLGADAEEPTQWNSFKTAGGSLVGFAQKQLKQSTVVRPGTLGNYSALIWSRSTLGIIANGNITTGKINMGNVVPGDPSNYNATVTTDPLFSEAFSGDPDSIVFWVKFVPASGSTDDSARMRAVIHDSYDYRDPSGSDANGPDHVFSAATLHFVKTNGQWVRMSAPFVPGPASTSAYMLLTFTTNMTPGGGSAADSLYIDDVEFIYNGAGLSESGAGQNNALAITVAGDQLTVNFSFSNEIPGSVNIYNVNGQRLISSKISAGSNNERLDIRSLKPGIYFLQIRRNNGKRVTKEFVIQ